MWKRLAPAAVFAVVFVGAFFVIARLSPIPPHVKTPLEQAADQYKAALAERDAVKSKFDALGYAKESEVDAALEGAFDAEERAALRLEAAEGALRRAAAGR